jgi:transposase
MRPYSLDLRQKIIDTYLERKLPLYQIAQQFRVADSFVRKLIKQYRETGDIRPKQRMEQTPTKLNESQLITLEALVAEHNDATLAELCQLLEEAVGVRISVTTMFRMLQRLKITLKKNTTSRREGNRASTAGTI